MSDDYASPFSKSRKRFGSCLEHGCAHGEEHRQWSRRDFMAGLGLAAGGAFVLGNTPVHAFARSPLLERLRQVASDRILVLVQLDGGNDGLNTIVPVDDPLYYRARPRLSIPKQATLPLADTLGMHPSLEALAGLYGDGQMAVVQSVGYPAADLSHFRSTDIWVSASEADVYWTTGWTGRLLEQAYPTFDEAPPTFPLAVQLGGLSSMLFQGSRRNMGMSLTNPELFERLAREGTVYDAQDVPPTPYGGEVAFLRTTANDAFRYARAIQEAAAVGRNDVVYPAVYENYLAQNLAIVARLIKGNLGARVYHVSLGGFDTHAEQGRTGGWHATLLRYLAEAVRAFGQDLQAGGWAEHVLIMTFSEFGRRVEENGSEGTDHGTAAPLFLFGPGVNGGLYGAPPSLSDLDGDGNMKHTVDFRTVYATVLQDWFGFDAVASEGVLGYAHDPLAVIADPLMPTAVEPDAVPEAFVLWQNYPNPFNPATTITYTLGQAAPVRLRVYDVRGRLVRTLVDAVQPGGAHTVSFDAERLPSGSYFYRLDTPDGSQTRQMTLVR
jgi:uncharacterized protein (DUF1501 family)